VLPLGKVISPGLFHSDETLDGVIRLFSNFDGAGGEIGPLALRFTLTAIVAFGAAWGAGSFAIGAPVAPGPLITEAILTILLFPIFAWLFARRKERSTFS
jgi:rod shape-determining protein MreD